MFLGKYLNIIFDLDGTLIDTGEGIINAIYYCIAQRNMKTIDKRTAKSFVGPPLVESFAKVFNLTKKEATECARVFRVYYAEKGKFESKPYDGIIELLTRLNKLGCRLFVGTSKPTVFAKDIIDNCQLTKLFVDIQGSNLDNTLSKKSEVIDYLVNKYRLEREDTIMVGDKHNDIEAAKKAGIDSLGVLYGYGGKTEIKGAKPTYIAETVEDIEKRIMGN